MRRSDERPHLGALVVGRADLHRADLLLHALEHVVRDRIADEYGDGDGHAALAGRAVGRADQRIRRQFGIGVRHDHRVILGAAQRLHALAVRGARREDVLGDRRRADEAHGLDVRMREQRVDRLLVAVDDVEDAIRQARFLEQRGEDQRRRRVALGGLQHERVAADERHRKHPQRNHRGKIERRDAGDHAQRLAQRVRVDPGADVFAELAFQELWRAARVFDDLDAARELAGGVGEHLAVLARDHGDDLVGALLEQPFEAEHDARARQRRGRSPGGKGGLRGLDGPRDFGGARERDAAAKRTRRRRVDVAETAGRAGSALAADPMGEGGNVGLAKGGRGIHDGISGGVAGFGKRVPERGGGTNSLALSPEGRESRGEPGKMSPIASNSGRRRRADCCAAPQRGRSMKRKVLVAGVGLVPFAKPGASDPYDVMGAGAASAALADAGVAYVDVEQAFVGYVYGDSTAGQKTLYRVGMTGIPIFNVNNNCSTGSTALYLARQAVESGVVECALALGFEQMVPGALTTHFNDRPTPFDDFNRETDALVGAPDVPLAIRYFGGAGLSHMRKYGTKIETFAKIRAKASRHAARNPMALFRKEVTVADVMASPVLMPGVMTRLMACPPTCGAAAAVLVSEAFAARHHLDSTVWIAAQAMTTDLPGTFADHDMMQLVGHGLTKAAARQVYEEAALGPDDVDVVELHDCFAQNELLAYEGLGLCGDGEGERLVEDGDNTYGGRFVTNPSGGLLSKGHPLGATGLAQCFELTQQLRGTADERQVDGARIGLQHNLGLGGACVVTMYRAA